MTYKTDSDAREIGGRRGRIFAEAIRRGELPAEFVERVVDGHRHCSTVDNWCCAYSEAFLAAYQKGIR